MDVTAGLPCHALAILLQQPAVAADQRIVCSMLQVCKAWRAEVQQSEGSFTDIVVSVDSKQLSGLAGVGAWLSKYPGLVRTLNISKATSHSCNERESATLIRTMLELSLQLAALGGSTRTVACNTGRAAAQWRLQSYQSDLGATAVMLAALPAATLTRLDIRKSPLTDSLADPLQRLTSLAELAIHQPWAYAPAPVVAAISALRQLTCLSLKTADMVCLQQLPVQLQQMTVYCGTGGMLNLGHLSNLQQLNLSTDHYIDSGSLLPAQLQQLTVACENVGPVHVLGLSGLQRLQCLVVESAITDPRQLASLADMSQLHELQLLEQHVYGNAAIQCARMWSRLTMLRRLGGYMDSRDSDELIEACRLAATASSITSLELELEHLAPVLVEDDDATAGLRLCQHLKRLTQLKALVLLLSSNDDDDPGCGCLAELDVLHLTAMTALTRLVIEAQGGVDDSAVCALATSFKHLEHLSLQAGQLTTAAWPCLGLITGLRHLALPCYSGEVVDIGLRLLSSLTQLTYLGGFGVEGSAIDAFWRHIRSHQQQ